MRTGYIYTLTKRGDPFSVRYVGLTVCAPKKRLTEHLSAARRGVEDYRVYRWIRSIDFAVEMTVIEILPAELLSWAEMYWIHLYKLAGANLTNRTPGGGAKWTWDTEQRLCTIEGCRNFVSAFDLCGTHRARQRKEQDLTRPIVQVRLACSIEGCSRKHKSRGLCKLHYERVSSKKNYTKSCKECSTSFTVTDARRQYCSIQCKKAGNRAERRAKKDTYSRLCTCGTLFTTTNSRKQYCSVTCQVRKSTGRDSSINTLR